MTEAIWKLSACEIGGAVRAGELSAKEVLEAFVDRIEAHNDELNALVFLDWEGAAAQAEEIDKRVSSGEDPGPLSGVPLGVKELEDVAGMPSTKASLLYEDRVAIRDGIQTARARASGAVIVGKTNAPEFGSTAFTRTKLFGTARNPWHLERTPGGSSGGSAAAVAAGLLPIATASDGGGSTRIPASYTGLFGAKGTFGRIPKGGPDSSLTTCYGCLSRTVRDAARFWDCVVGHHERDQYSLPHPGLSYEAVLEEPVRSLRFAWSDDLGFGGCAQEVSRVAKQAADALVQATSGEWADREVGLRDPSVAWGLVNQPDSWLNVRDFWPGRSEDLTPAVRAGIRDGERRFNMAEVASAVERRAENNERLAEIFDEIDVIVTPTTATTAFRAEGPMPTEIDGEPSKVMRAITFTYPFNMSGHPAFSLPCGFDSDGLPVGLQIVGRRHADHVLFQLAAAFEAARPWPRIASAYE